MMQTLQASEELNTNTTATVPAGQASLNIEAIYDKYAPAFYGEIKRTLYNEDISQKVMQEAFVKIYQALQKSEPANERVFITALKVVRNEISREKLDITLNQILYTKLQKRHQLLSL